jgi:hypothetical protein
MLENVKEELHIRELMPIIQVTHHLLSPIFNDGEAILLSLLQ